MGEYGVKGGGCRGTGWRDGLNEERVRGLMNGRTNERSKQQKERRNERNKERREHERKNEMAKMEERLGMDRVT